MPYLKLKTNKLISKEHSSEILPELSELLAKEVGKPESYVMVEIESEKEMIFSASFDDLAYLECKSIGLTSDQAKSLSASISQVLETRLHIPANRIYIEFNNCPAEYWGWNGSTFA